MAVSAQISLYDVEEIVSALQEAQQSMTGSFTIRNAALVFDVSPELKVEARWEDNQWWLYFDSREGEGVNEPR